MSALQHQLHAERVQRLTGWATTAANLAAAVQRPPQLPSPAQPPPINEKPLMPQPPPVARPIRVEITPEPINWFASVRLISVDEEPLEQEPPPNKYPAIKDIQRAVAAHYKIDLIDIFSQRRTANIVRPRQVAMYLAKILTLKSLPEIGRRFGGKDHTTVLHAFRKIEVLREDDAELASTIGALMGMLKPVEASVAEATA